MQLQRQPGYTDKLLRVDLTCGSIHEEILKPEVAVANGRPAVFRMEYNLLGRDAEAAFKKAKSADVGVVSRVPLKRGLLTGRFPVAHQFADGDVRSRVLT